MNINEMPGFNPSLYEPDLKWHAMQITIYEHGDKVKKVTADIRAKLTKAERWEKCAFNAKISLQGRSRDANRAMFRLSETLIQYGEMGMRDQMLSHFAETKEKLIVRASSENPQWDSKYIRSGFGRDPSAKAWVAGTSSMQPLNPGVYAHFDRSSMLLNFTIGNFNMQTQIDIKLSKAQKKVNTIGYSIILLDAPVYAAIPETGAQRLARFMSLGRETNTV
tara:strand:- start:404 stop:1066 length:663 start_codon:yes stop_codon:yes gene_type:complete